MQNRLTKLLVCKCFMKYHNNSKRPASRKTVSLYWSHIQGTGDESFGESGDTPHKNELIEKLKEQIWSYQKRDGDLLNRENAVLEKENQNKQVSYN